MGFKLPIRRRFRTGGHLPGKRCLPVGALAAKSGPMRTDLHLTARETEVLILKSAMESINSMVNFEMLERSGNDSDTEIRFKSSTDQRYFNIMLVDFLNSKMFQVRTKCLDALQSSFVNPQFGQNLASLRIAVNGFREWLDHYVELAHDGEVRKFWFPSIDSPALNGEIALQITRSEVIEICGNISKHNPLGLDRQATVVKEIFERSKTPIDLTQALLILREFYEQFHDDIFAYHSSTIAEFLNNIRLGIYEYLKPECEASIDRYWSPEHKRELYKFKCPTDVTNPFVQAIYWDLMNDILSRPYMLKFSVNKIFKLRY